MLHKKRKLVVLKLLSIGYPDIIFSVQLGHILRTKTIFGRREN